MGRMLKTCPFCGSGNIEIANDYIYEIPKKYAVHCHGCDAYGPSAESPAQASILWNKSYTRTIDSKKEPVDDEQ